MLTKSIWWVLAFGLCGVFAFPALGGASAAKGRPWTFVVDTPQAFEAQVAEVHKEMATDGKYGAIGVADRIAVDAELDHIRALLRKRGSAATLNDSEQVDLMNAQERVNAVLTKNDGNRLICTLEPRTGTNFKMKVCKTARELDQIRRGSKAAFRESHPAPVRSAVHWE